MDDFEHEAANTPQQTDSEETVDPFTRLMFGPNRKQNYPNESTSENTENNLQVNQIDYLQLMQQAEDIMNSYNRIKPMIKELSPLLDFFKKDK
ncbi:hypothetical protein LCL95_08460 [Bacillus timonensis]|nr:hypothetical protein [Bacillus timonensis]